MRRYVFVLGRKIIKKTIGSCLAVDFSLFPLCSSNSNCLFVRVFSFCSVVIYNLQDVFKNCSVTNQSCTNEFIVRGVVKIVYCNTSTALHMCFLFS